MLVNYIFKAKKLHQHHTIQGGGTIFINCLIQLYNIFFLHFWLHALGFPLHMSRFCNIIFYREDRKIMPALVSRIMASKEFYALIPRTCEHVRSHGKM